MILNFHNQWHLGDCFYTIHYLRKLIEYNNGLEINFFVQEKFFFELEEIIQNYKIYLKPLKEKPKDSIDTWINNNNLFKEANKNQNIYFDLFYVYLFNYISQKIGINNPISNKNDFIIDNDRFLKPNLLTKKYDYFIINSIPLSGQFNFIKKEFNKIVRILLNRGKSVITTEKTKFKNVPSTIEEKLTLADIGNISINVKNIVGIHTAPYLPCFNKWNIDEVNKWIIMQQFGLTYSFNNRIFNVKNYTELKKIL